MLLVATLWSMAGIVSRQFQTVGRFEATFWRSFFTVLGAAGLLLATQGRAWLGQLKQPHLFAKGLWASGTCWCVMFTAFMLALTLTTVANVLISMSLAPLATALLSWLWLKRRLPLRTVLAIALAVLGIVVMYASDVSALAGQHGLGVLIACSIPLAAAVNWNLSVKTGAKLDLIPAVFLGAVMSSASTLPFAMPFVASGSDIGWLAVLGVFQLALPCMICMWCARQLPAAELSLLCLLEILLGVAWVWLFAGERPAPQVLVGGAIVLLALAGNELLGFKKLETQHV